MRVVVGRIGRAQGIRGEVNVEIRTDAPEERFSPGAVLFLEPSGGAGAQPVTVAGSRWQGGRLVVALAGVVDRTAAEALRGRVLTAEVDITATGEDEYHDLALVGLEVRDVTGAHVGTIGEVLHLPGQDLLSVLRPGLPEVLVPFVRAIVAEVDLDGGFVVVDMPEGLAELGAP